MEKKTEAPKKKRRIFGHWSLRKELQKRIDLMGETDANTQEYKDNLNSVKDLVYIKNQKLDSRAKVGQVATAFVLGAIGLYAAFQVDKSDEILRNKNSMNMFNRIFHI